MMRPHTSYSTHGFFLTSHEVCNARLPSSSCAFEYLQASKFHYSPAGTRTRKFLRLFDKNDEDENEVDDATTIVSYPTHCSQTHYCSSLGRAASDSNITELEMTFANEKDYQTFWTLPQKQ